MKGVNRSAFCRAKKIVLLAKGRATHGKDERKGRQQKRIMIDRMIPQNQMEKVEQ